MTVLADSTPPPEVNDFASGPSDEDSGALLAGSGIPVYEAVRLLGVVTGATRSALVGGMSIDQGQSARFRRLVDRRLSGEPLQYLEGTAPFGPLELVVDRRVLIPRPETEQLWERALELLPRRPCTVVDLGTGSGCLALGIKFRRPDIRVIATDISSDAIEVARHNACLLVLDVEFHHGDRLAALVPSLRGRVEMIVTNPPYVAESEWAGLPSEIRDHEPRVALVMGDGLEMYRYLAFAAAPWLAPTGMLMSEIGDRQGQAVRRLFGEAGWRATIARDLTGRDRFLMARKHR